MLDRASTFADPVIINLLQTQFVPVAIDQAYQRRQKDTEGEFYRSLARQGPRNNFESSTQGFYIATAGGKLLVYNNNRGPRRIRDLMLAALATYDPDEKVSELDKKPADPRYLRVPPEGGLIVRVHARVLSGYAPPKDQWERIYQQALARDNMWVTRSEREALAKGRLPDSLVQRLVRYHLVDNTRGEPPFWKPDDIRQLDVTLQDGQLRGSVAVETAGGERSYRCELYGVVEHRDGQVRRFDLVAKGQFRGRGRWTPGCPEGDFPLAVAFSLADGSDTADQVPPQGSKGWLPGYLDRS